MYKNCVITLENSNVWKDYVVYIKQEYHTGIDLFADNIYSPCKGVVIQVCNVDKYLGVVIQYSEHVGLRFTHLESVFVNPGDIVENKQKIGLAKNFVHFEYLTTEANNPAFKVRIGELEFYKHDPRLVLNGNVKFDQTKSQIEYSPDLLYSNYMELNTLIENEIGKFEATSVYNTFEFDLNGDYRD